MARLLENAGIIRNRLKVNAQRVLELRKEHDSFKGWLDTDQNLSKEDWVKLFKKTFVFTGGEIADEIWL